MSEWADERHQSGGAEEVTAGRLHRFGPKVKWLCGHCTVIAVRLTRFVIRQVMIAVASKHS
jgi:hypothetical protein